jgi:hypothetical protein
MRLRIAFGSGAFVSEGSTGMVTSVIFLPPLNSFAFHMAVSYFTIARRGPILSPLLRS